MHKLFSSVLSSRLVLVVCGRVNVLEVLLLAQRLAENIA